MFNISLKADLDELKKRIHWTQKDQIPYVTMLALNNTAFQARSAIQQVLDVYIDKPTPYTARGVQVEKVNYADRKDIDKMGAKVGFVCEGFGKMRGKIKPSEYMTRLIEGGIRLPEKTALAIPTSNLRLNKFGNITRGKIAKLLGDPHKYFSGVPNNQPRQPSGIWQRTPKRTPGKKRKKRGRTARADKRSIKPLILWKQSASYKKQFPLHKIVQQSVSKTFVKEFEKVWQRTQREKL